MIGRLILFPVGIGHDDLSRSLPSWNSTLLDRCKGFIVEERRTARRFLRAAGFGGSLDDELFFVLDEHTVSRWSEEQMAFERWMAGLSDGCAVGLLSEAGLPCVADPGALAVGWAHLHGVTVTPLVGPSSLMLALMGSGLNGQSFAFNGYLPVDPTARSRRIRELERRALNENQTQIFIEAPYRNNQLLDALCSTCQAQTLISIATDLTLESQQILTHSAADWQTLKTNVNLHKRNTVFLIGKGQDY